MTVSTAPRPLRSLQPPVRRAPRSSPAPARRSFWRRIVLALSAKRGWWVRRIAAFPLHVFVFAIAAFFLVRLIPGDPVLAVTGGQSLSGEQYAQIQESLGLAGALTQQFLSYLGSIARFDLGTSLQSGDPVATLIAQRLPATLQLSVIALVFTVALTIAISLLVALFPSKVVSRILDGYSRTAGAIPDFVLGLACISVLYVLLKLIPAPLGTIDRDIQEPSTVTGFSLLDALLEGNLTAFGSLVYHLVTPILVLVLAYTPIMARVLIETLSHELQAPASLFRVSTGARRTRVVRSALRRAFPPVMPVVATIFGFMIGGALVVEQLFSMTGMGTLAVQAVKTTDITTLEGFLLVIGALSLFVYLAADLVTMLLDSRRRPGLAGGER